MMNKTEFDKYSFARKGRIVFSEGQFISSREYYNQRLVLYDLGEFFAEVWYKPDQNEIHKIESLPQTDQKIDLYLKAY